MNSELFEDLFIGGALAMLNAADLTHNSGMEEWDNEVDITCCTFGAPAAGNKGTNLLVKLFLESKA